MSKNPSLRKAIDAHCKSCIFDPLSGLGTWRQQVEKCTVTTCKLYPVRPISAGKKRVSTGKQPEALRRYQQEKKAAENG